MIFVARRTSQGWTKLEAQKPPFEGAVWSKKHKRWIVKITSLKALVALVREEGSIVMEPMYDDDEELLKIEVYDDYRE